jgi:hypothetical protein
MKHIVNKLFRYKSEQDFNALALKIFSFQYKNNPVYQKYCKLLGKHPKMITSLHDIPFLPIEFFKTHRIASVKAKEKLVFHSSGTTGSTPSSHLVFDLGLYEESILMSFWQAFGHPENFVFISLIPDFAQRPDSSLAYMAQTLIQQSNHPLSGFYLGREHEIADIAKNIKDRRVFFWGISFALMDYVEQFPQAFVPHIVMETGGMKGKRKEITRSELHQALKHGLTVNTVSSEYSMCELFSQAYAHKEGHFYPALSMKVLMRDPHDPLTLLEPGNTGGINIIDLANVNTCSFIATQDLGMNLPNGGFTVIGRFDYSALRGCSLMLE